jgi:hypothetical protein
MCVGGVKGVPANIYSHLTVVSCFHGPIDKNTLLVLRRPHSAGLALHTLPSQQMKCCTLSAFWGNAVSVVTQFYG